jgi:hypothetical protein
MPVDKVLQCMFFTFLDILIEEKLKPEVYAFRKGRNVKMAVASVYFKLSRVYQTKQICLCSVSIEKCFDNILHDSIVKQYPFPKNYIYLLVRWLTPSRVSKNQNFKSLGRVSRGVCKSSFLGPSMVNLMLSNCFPNSILQEKIVEKKKSWLEIFSYADSVVLISNSASIFYAQFVRLKKNLSNIGLSFSSKMPVKSFVGTKSNIRFQYMGFDFKVVLKRRLKRSCLFSSIKSFYYIKKGFGSFGIILRPHAEKIKAVKKRLKVIIKRILHEPRDQMYKAFQLINSILLSWGSYYYFNQGCEYGKRLDNFVFTYLKKILVKKFRYNGLFRPK